MIEPSIKSRPVYGTLRATPAAHHLMVADGEGAAAILDLAASAPPGFFGRPVLAHAATRAGAAALLDRPAAPHPSPPPPCPRHPAPFRSALEGGVP